MTNQEVLKSPFHDSHRLLALAADSVIFTPRWVKHLDVGSEVPIPCNSINDGKQRTLAGVTFTFMMLSSHMGCPISSVG